MIWIGMLIGGSVVALAVVFRWVIYDFALVASGLCEMAMCWVCKEPKP